jgi:hypothetical protein
MEKYLKILIIKLVTCLILLNSHQVFAVPFDDLIINIDDPIIFTISAENSGSEKDILERTPIYTDGLRPLIGIDGTFGYETTKRDLNAEVIFNGNMTYEEVLSENGYDYINFIQIVTAYPSGPLVKDCLSNVPYFDPTLGGCTEPADNSIGYYDVGDEWIGTDYYLENKILTSVDRAKNTLVNIGLTFSDSPSNIWASNNNLMEFIMFPAGIFNNGRTYEPLIESALYWTSSNNAIKEVFARNNPNPLLQESEEDYINASFVPFKELPDEYLELLKDTGFSEPSKIPLPATFWLLVVGFISFRAFLRKL